MIHLLLLNDIIIFITLMLCEDLGSVNLRHKLYMHVCVECDFTGDIVIDDIN